jgi:hypothetical protein
MSSNSTTSILRRLEADGHLDLLTAVHQRRISPYAAACIVGYFRRKPAKGPPGEDNRSRRRLGDEGALLREIARK